MNDSNNDNDELSTLEEAIPFLIYDINSKCKYKHYIKMKLKLLITIMFTYHLLINLIASLSFNYYLL